MIDYPYNNVEVRDLAWACFSPPILLSRDLVAGSPAVDNCALELTPARLQWLSELDDDPSPLRDHIATISSHRLGIYFEGLWHFFLGEDPSIDLIAHNLAIRDNGRTLGEIDCLYFCHERQRHVHLELAVKYFLSHRVETAGEAVSTLSEWWGPGCDDRLDIKVDHLMSRQIQLTDQPVAMETLRELGIGELAREVEIKGYLFQSVRDPLPPPCGYNPSRDLSQWIHFEDLASHCGQSEWQYFVTLPKRQWLSPARDATFLEYLYAEELHDLMQDHFSTQSRPKLVAALNRQHEEVARFFVVANDWPNREAQQRSLN